MGGSYICGHGGSGWREAAGLLGGGRKDGGDAVCLLHLLSPSSSTRHQTPINETILSPAISPLITSFYFIHHSCSPVLVG